MKQKKNIYKILNVILKVFTYFSKFVDTLIKQKGLCVRELLIVILLTLMHHYVIPTQLHKWFLDWVMVSILLFTTVQHIIYLVGGGRSSWRLILNVSIYFHLIILIGSLFKKWTLIWILIFLVLHFRIIYYQYIIGKNIFGVNEKFLKGFCALEIISVLISANHHLLTWLGRWIVYNMNIHFY